MISPQTRDPGDQRIHDEMMSHLRRLRAPDVTPEDNAAFLDWLTTNMDNLRVVLASDEYWEDCASQAASGHSSVHRGREEVMLTRKKWNIVMALEEERRQRRMNRGPLKRWATLLRIKAARGARRIGAQRMYVYCCLALAMLSVTAAPLLVTAAFAFMRPGVTRDYVTDSIAIIGTSVVLYSVFCAGRACAHIMRGSDAA